MKQAQALRLVSKDEEKGRLDKEEEAEDEGKMGVILPCMEKTWGI